MTRDDYWAKRYGVCGRPTKTTGQPCWQLAQVHRREETAQLIRIAAQRAAALDRRIARLMAEFGSHRVEEAVQRARRREWAAMSDRNPSDPLANPHPQSGDENDDRRH